MKYLLTEEISEIPDKVDVDIKSREITVKGPLGKIKKSFKHIPIDIFKTNAPKKAGKKASGKVVRVQMWLAKRKQRAKVRSVISTIDNMFRGVTSGYKYKMRMAYAHFPIQALITGNGAGIEIKNFLGEKVTRKIAALPDVKISKKEEEKDTITV
mmetsp:Transcript_128511/g.181266  ORF Transcript_128511/g.181266 Transcript_128511/m.181266 type:complete len:155 (+) Transcript_128511:48-512(+)